MSNRPPFVSVVVPVHNGGRLVDRALRSLLRQSFPDWEAWVVDDGSTDDTAAVVATWAATDPRIRLIRLPANSGVSAARNAALERANGEWVAYLDHDDEFDPEYLARIHRHQADGDVLVFRYDLTEERPDHPDFGRTYRYDPAPFHEKLFQQHIAVPLGVAHRRALLDYTGGFDERRPVEQDSELWRRFATTGATFAFVPEVSGLYHIRSGSVARTNPPDPPMPDRPAPRPWPGRPPAPPSDWIGPAATPAVTPSPDRPRVMFASYHCFDDPASGAALCTRDLFDQLSARGWACGVFTGPHLDSPNRPVGERWAARPDATAHRGWHGPLTFTLHHSTADGYPVSVFAPDPPAATRPPTPTETQAFARLLAEAVRRFRPDVVLTYGGDPASRTVPAVARAGGAKTAFWLHNFAYPDRDCFAPCDAVVVPSAFSRDRHREKLGIETVALPPVLGLARFLTPPDTDARCVTFVNPEPTKGVYPFARLADVLARTRPDIPLLVVEGRGRFDRVLSAGVDLSHARSLTHLPNTPDPRAFYRRSRVVVMPSVWWESFGRVAAEAMLNGLPVVASDRGALPEVVGAGGVCLPLPDWLTPDTPRPPSEAEMAGWVAAVTRAWDDPAAGSAAATAWAGRWHPDAVTPRWEQFLGELAGKRVG